MLHIPLYHWNAEARKRNPDEKDEEEQEGNKIKNSPFFFKPIASDRWLLGTRNSNSNTTSDYATNLMRPA